MNGMPSENVDNLDRRVMELQKKYEDLQHCFNEMYAETRDLVHEKKKAKEAQKKEEGAVSGE